MSKKPTCFVIIGYGTKTSYATGQARELNLDETFEDLIKPVFDELDIDCYRAIDKNLTGSIDKLMLEEIKNADIVVADLSTLNANVMWELGVRHALKPRFTIMICEKEQMSSIPFDVSHYPVHQYVHTDYGIPHREVPRFRNSLKAIVTGLLDQPSSYADSPVFDILGEDPWRSDMLNVIQYLKDATDIGQKDILTIEDLLVPGKSSGAGVIIPDEKKEVEEQPFESEPFAVLMDKAEKAKNRSDFGIAMDYLKKAEKLAAENMSFRDHMSHIVSRQALCTYKAKQPTELEGFLEARNILRKLNPERSQDVEVLGLSGKINKQLHELTGDTDYLDAAIVFYEKGFKLKNDYYNGINTVFMLYRKASLQKEQQQEWEDLKVNADYIRNTVLKDLLILEQAEDFVNSDESIWILLTIAEAYQYKQDGQKTLAYEMKAAELAARRKNTFALSSYYEQKEKINIFYTILMNG